MIGKTNVQSSVTEKTVNDWGFTKNAGTVTGVKINGTTKSPNSSGIVDLGTIEGGSGGGGGGITTEIDPIFSASPAAKITDDNISSWNNKVSELESVLFGKFKDALIECFKNVAWINEKGNELVGELETSLNIEDSDTGGDTDYVKDGLMFWFDGINNTAEGHNSDSTYWEDLTGNGFHLYAYSDSNLVTPKKILFNSNHVGLDGSTILVSVGKRGMIDNLLANNPGTLEVVFKQLDSVTSVIFMTYAADDQLENTKGLWYRQASGGYVYKFATTGNGVATATGQFSEAKSFSHVYPDGLTLIDGEVFSETIEGGNLSSNITSISVGGRTHINGGNGYFAQAEIYAIRYYERELTESERLQNFNLDKKRFGL